jgi:hydroxylamine oxidation protein HaoB
MTSPARRGNKLLPSLGILLVTGGILLLAWFSWLWFNPGPAPYRYQLAEEGPVSKFPKLGLDAWPDLTIARYEVYAEGVDQPLAEGHTARRGSGAPVLLDWENRSSELLASLDSKLNELAALSAAIAKHAPKDALVLAWWDTSRQINLLSGRDTLFKSHIAEPLIVPAVWRERKEAIGKYEDQFWGARASEDERRKFQRFADALLSEPGKGAAILRELATSPTSTNWDSCAPASSTSPTRTSPWKATCTASSATSNSGCRTTASSPTPCNR